MKIVKKLLTAILVVIIIMNLYVLASKLIFKNNLPKIFGYSNAIVASDSMYPTFKTGDLLIFKEESKYKKEDVIIFEDQDSYVTHRIVGSNDSGFITKGDNNESNDKDTVKNKNIRGKLVFKLAGVGNIIRFFTSFKGIIILLLIYLIFEFCKLLNNKEGNKNNNITLVGILLITTIVTPTLSRYIMNIDAVDTTTVAKVYMDGNVNELTTEFESFNPGEVRTFNFQVINYDGDVLSDVNQDYTITLETTGNLPLEYELVVLDPSDYNYADDFELEGTKYVAKNGQMGYTEKETHTYQLRVTATSKSYDTYYMKEIDAIKLIIDGVQKRD